MRSLGRHVEPREGRPLCWRRLAPLTAALVPATRLTALTAAPAVETSLKRQQKSSKQAPSEPGRPTIPHVTVDSLLLRHR